MDLLNISFNYPHFIINMDVIPVIIILLILVILIYKSRSIKNYFKTSNIEVEGAAIGIKDSTIKLKINQKDKEIAYKLWIELSTRKIGIPIDIENDVIIELYDSWYEFFKLSRETLKEFPISKLNEKDNDIIRINIDVLNESLRPNLTKWQAKYRYWYSKELKKLEDKKYLKTPQEIQRNYPEYKELIKDLQKTNEELIHYREILYKIVFGKK